MAKWEAQARTDLARADAAHQQGNEGRVRVCARRAAGWAAKAYLESTITSDIKNSGFQNISQLAEEGLLSDGDIELVEHLTVSIVKEDPEAESIWPAELDLLSDARKLILRLFPNFED